LRAQITDRRYVRSRRHRQFDFRSVTPGSSACTPSWDFSFACIVPCLRRCPRCLPWPSKRRA